MKAVILMLLVVLVAQCGASSCKCLLHLPVEQRPCPPPTGCKGGLVLDHCQCCMTCAKVLGESCEGEFGLEGSCDRGLGCTILRSDLEVGSAWHPHVTAGICTLLDVDWYNSFTEASTVSGSNSDQSTTYPSVPTTTSHTVQPKRRRRNSYLRSFYPAGPESTTTATHHSVAPTVPNQNHHQAFYPTTTTRTEYGSGVSTQPNTNWQSFYPTGLASTTSRPRNVYGVSTQHNTNWQSFYPTGLQTTTSRTRDYYGVSTQPYNYRPTLYPSLQRSYSNPWRKK